VKKNKLYIFISIATLVCLLATAALCNKAGATEDEAPTLKLEISEGPVFSKEDSTCSYEIEAIVTGTPEPDIEFALDDNVSLLATEKAKVVLEDSNSSYTLEATATNAEGSTIASINLSWGCEEEVASEEELEDEEETTEDEEEATEDEEEVEEEQDNQGEVLEGDPFPPELSIFIYEGPIYSAADDVCYYRIASELYGNPYPELTWSKDDSGSAFGYDKVQINLKRGETYTLTATATNTEGTITRTIDLEWGCDVEEVAGDSGGDDAVENENEILEMNLPLVNPETVTLFKYSNGGWGYNDSGIFPGEGLADEVTTMGFISIDITSLASTNLEDAVLTMNCLEIYGDTSAFNKFYIGSLYWGEKRPGIEEYDSAINRKIAEYPSSGNGNITCDNPVLKEEIQKAINQGKSRFQLKVYFSGSNINDQRDGRYYSKSDIILAVKYSK